MEEARLANEHEANKEATKATAKVKRAASGLSQSVAVAESWKDPKVAEKRLTRDGVRVSTIVDQEETDLDYRSTAAAFRELGLPLSKHIRFRAKLKAAKVAVFEHEGVSYHFEII